MAANMLLASRSIRSRRRAAASFGGKGGRIRNHGADQNCTGGRIKLQRASTGVITGRRPRITGGIGPARITGAVQPGQVKRIALS